MRPLSIFRRTVAAAGMAAALSAFAGPRDVRAAAPPYTDDALAAIRAELPTLRLSEPDLALSTGAALAFPLAPVETFFSTPLAFPAEASAWADRAEGAQDLTPLFDLGNDILGGSPKLARYAGEWEPPADLPSDLQTILTRLSSAIVAARPYVARAAASVSSGDRDAFASLYDWGEGRGFDEEYSSRRIHRALSGMDHFREKDLRAGARVILSAVDECADILSSTAPVVKKRVRLKSPAGTVLIGGSGDDTYDASDLKGVAILIDPGGRNTYTAPPAAAGPGDIFVAIDGGTVTIRTNAKSFGGPASARFGVSALVLTNRGAAHTIETGPYAAGAALGGVAAFESRGPCKLKTGGYSQGIGIFGMGLFLASSPNASYESGAASQGVGFTRGFGAFRHDGDNAALRGGLVDPDPREPQAAVSLCQGVGSGPRAYAGGGVGLCVLTGNRISTLASYFAQGSGYWHAAGVFRLRGNNATIQSRRYSLGAGVHSAFGHFEAFGDDNRILNWGVGPAYGWDHGVGTAIAAGDRLEVQADWGVGTAQVGGRAFGFFSSAGGKYKIPEAGGGLFFRNESAYSIQIYQGTGSFQSFGELPAVSGRVVRNAWGVARIDSGTFVNDLSLAPLVWPAFGRDEAKKRQAADLKKDLDAAAALPPLDSVGQLVDVASAFSLDKEAPREALRRLLTLPEDQAPLLVQALDPAAIDQLIQLSIVIPAHGDDAARALLNAPADPARDALLTWFLRNHRPSTVLDSLRGRMASADPKVALAAARAIGSLLNRDTGDEPGTRAALEAVAAALSRKKEEGAAVSLLSRVRFPDAIGLLAYAAPLQPAERVEFLAAAPEDLTEKIADGGARKFLEIAGRHPESAGLVAAELKALDAAEAPVRKALATMAGRTERGAAETSIVAAGQIGNSRDVRWIEPHLNDERAGAREAAAVALGRMGKGGLPALRRASSARSPRVRAMAAFATSAATDPAAGDLLIRALSDPDPLVALTAVGVLKKLPKALEPQEASLKKKAAALAHSGAGGRDLELNLSLIR